MDSFVEHLEYLRKVALNLRVELLYVLNHVGSGHLGGVLSVLDILVALYYGQLPDGPVLRYDVDKPGFDGQDYLVFSKGHSVLALYNVLADVGFFDKEELLHYRQLNGMLQSYPFYKVAGVSVSTGFPGYGVSAALGLALSLKNEKRDNRVVCIVGDGELQSGVFWESVLVASQYKLDNLTLIVDWNRLQGDGALRAVVDVDSIADKFGAFGWKSIPVFEGHNFEDLLLGIEKGFDVKRRPSVVIARTVKGKGVPFAENKAYYHSEALSDEELQEAVKVLQEALRSL